MEKNEIVFDYIPEIMMSETDINSIKKLSKRLSNKDLKICEIGCWKGKSTVALAKIAKAVNGRLYSIDHWKGTENTPFRAMADEADIFQIWKTNLSGEGLSDYVEPVKSLSSEAVKMFEDNFFDFIFIDGDHKYEACLEDITMWYQKLKPDGIISGHDCDLRYENLAQEEQKLISDNKDVDCFKGCTHGGVIRAVFDFFNIDYECEGRVWSHRKLPGEAIKTGLICTMLRSGTQWLQWFFAEYGSQIHPIIGAPTTAGHKYKGLDEFFICHAEYPNALPDKKRDELQYWTDGYTLGNQCIKGTLSSGPMVYIYRNPLDEMMSLWLHNKQHKNEIHQEAGKMLFKDFVFKHALDSYIKQFLSWWQVRDNKRILLIKYEDLVNNADEVFTHILNHLKIELDKRALNVGLAWSSKNVLKLKEKEYGLANDQLSIKGTHIHNADNQWKKYLNEEDLGKIEDCLNEFGLSLTMFTGA